MREDRHAADLVNSERSHAQKPDGGEGIGGAACEGGDAGWLSGIFGTGAAKTGPVETDASVTI